LAEYDAPYEEDEMPMLHGDMLADFELDNEQRECAASESSSVWDATDVTENDDGSRGYTPADELPEHPMNDALGMHGLNHAEYLPPSRLLSLPGTGMDDLLVEIGTPPRGGVAQPGSQLAADRPSPSTVGQAQAQRSIQRAASWVLPINGSASPLVGSMQPVP